ncbi:MAG: hypothetical protein Q4D98_10370 [Planctomycetia bacterium]|nr:hypothetical protein [Planctomycetia bacterium]
MSFVDELTEKVLQGYAITHDDMRQLVNADLNELQRAACRLRQTLMGNRLEFFGFIIFRDGENLSADLIYREAMNAYQRSAHCFEIDLRHNSITPHQQRELLDTCKRIRRETGMALTLSHATMTQKQFVQFRECGVTFYHEMLGYPKKRLDSLTGDKRSSLTYDEKVQLLKTARSAGLQITSGAFYNTEDSSEVLFDFTLELKELDLFSFLIREPEWITGNPAWHSGFTRQALLRALSILRFTVPKMPIILGGIDQYLPERGNWILNSSVNGTRNLCAEAFDVTMDNIPDTPHNMGFIIF